MSKISYVITDTNLVLVDSSGVPAILARSQNPAAFTSCVSLIGKGKLKKALSLALAPGYWLTNLHPDLVETENEGLTFKGKKVPNSLLSMLGGRSSTDRLLKFLERLHLNPSYRAVTELSEFIASSESLTIGEDGCILAFKGVREDYLDVHSGTFDNSPGKTCEMPRNEVDDNRERTCSYGLHVANWDYGQSWSVRVMLVSVDPADVVSVPADYSGAKLRCCKYVVIEEIDKDGEV